MADPASNDQAGQARNIVASLRAALSGESTLLPEAILGSLDALDELLSRVLVEHAGMANDLLQAYEQLGIVFEVTRKLANVSDERQVLRLFVKSLEPTYPNTQVIVVQPDRGGRLAVGQKDVVLPDWVVTAIERSRDQRRVMVTDCPECHADEQMPGCSGCPSPRRGEQPIVRVACAPVYAGDALVCVLALCRRSFDTDDAPGGRAFDASDVLLLESLSVFCGDIIRNFRLMAELRQLSVDMVRTLINAIEQKDEYTSGHTTRVAKYAVMIGKKLGLGRTELQMLEWSALLHDVGKIGIRDDVLKKPGRLTDEEFEHIKEHPVRSYNVVREVPQLAAALDGVVHHHEHWDGSGYPEGLAGAEIPLQARIIQVADIFDALTSTRSYRQAYTWDKALSILQQESGKTVDPKLAVRFDRLIREIARDDPQRLERLMAVRRGCCSGPLSHPPPADRSDRLESGCGRVASEAKHSPGGA